MSEKEFWRAEVRYRGTDFCGWQKQPDPNSVQQHIEEALSRLFKGQKITIQGSGRTDSGVHALAQAFSFSCPQRYDASTLEKAINGIVPRDISVRQLRQTGDDFHARYSARGKTYTYLIDNSFFANPLLRDYSWHVAKKLDLDLMRQGLTVLTGEHDFASFTAKIAEREGASTVREIERFETSVFNAHYVTGDVDQNYLEYLESLRGDDAKKDHEAQNVASLDIYNEEI